MHTGEAAERRLPQNLRIGVARLLGRRHVSEERAHVFGMPVEREMAEPDVELGRSVQRCRRRTNVGGPTNGRGLAHDRSGTTTEAGASGRQVD